jgi:hypothetical protein
MRLSAEIQPLLDEQARLRAREALLLRLLESFAAPSSTASHLTSEAAGPSAARGFGEGSVKDYVRRCATEILKASQQPLHINQVHAEFVSRGFRIPGAGKAANLTAHLGRADGIVSPGRGLYALATADNRPKPRAARKRRRRRRAKAP